ncbi:MAG: hypothetical protein FJZ04_00705 [Candidatus Moranbacteria bacterium]|nr:hypothetical protein [Candidatus Moranbacteria bacterium]
MAKKQKKIKKKREKEKNKKNKPKGKSKDKVSKLKVQKLGIDTDPERREIWKRNLVLGGIIVVLALLNIWLFSYRRENGQNLESEVRQIAEPAESESQEDRKPTDMEPIENKEWGGVSETEKDRIRQALLRKITEKWATYKNTAYNFELKYPDNWAKPAVENAAGAELKYKTKIAFRDTGMGPEAGQKGFDIYIYRLPRGVRNISADYSNNLNLKDGVNEEFGRCKEIGTASVGSAKYPAMKIYALASDPCYKESYFYLLQRGGNAFEIVPVPAGGFGYENYDGAREVGETLPEFDNILATWKFTAGAGAVRKAVPRITAPKPLAETRIVSGKRVCAKKNDKPRKSKTNKKKHMDMECCLDPDEYPNPWCSY